MSPKMSTLNKNITLMLAEQIIMQSVPYDDPSRKNIRMYIPYQPWTWADGTAITLRVALDIFEKSVKGTDRIDVKRERFAGHLCGYGYGNYDEILILLNTWPEHMHD
jgi:hypothetical protein